MAHRYPSKLASRTHRVLRVAALVSGAFGAVVVRGEAQPGPTRPGDLPFAVGERLGYDVHLSRFGGGGHGEFRVDSVVDVRGTTTWLLRSKVETRVGVFKAENRSASWLDPRRMASLRFWRRERSLGSGSTESVQIYPDSGRWKAENGRSGEIVTDAPLDELSFIYFLRTVPLREDTTYRFDRHFDASRNPTTVQVVGREAVRTALGTYETLIVEMHVKDPARYKGEGVIRINFTDDDCRVPVRIESRVPFAGTAVLTLSSWTEPGHHQAASAPQ